MKSPPESPEEHTYFRGFNDGLALAYFTVLVGLLLLIFCACHTSSSPPSPPPTPPPPLPPLDVNVAFEELVGGLVATNPYAVHIVGLDYDGRHYAVFSESGIWVWGMTITNGKTFLVRATSLWEAGIRLTPPCAYSNVVVSDNLLTNLGETTTNVNTFTNEP